MPLHCFHGVNVHVCTWTCSSFHTINCMQYPGTCKCPPPGFHICVSCGIQDWLLHVYIILWCKLMLWMKVTNWMIYVKLQIWHVRSRDWRVAQPVRQYSTEGPQLHTGPQLLLWSKVLPHHRPPNLLQDGPARTQTHRRYRGTCTCTLYDSRTPWP